MKISFLLLSIVLVGCASRGSDRANVIKENNAQVFSYRDVSGEFELSREVKFSKGKLATRVQVLAAEGGSERLLEKTFAISAVGSVKSQGGRANAVRPELSQHTVWLEGKKYFTQLKLNPRKRALEAIMDSPDSRWQGKKDVKLPRGRIFCFYSQLPECLVVSDMLSAADNGRRRSSFIIVWDSWPYHQEHFTGLKASPFASATIAPERAGRNDRRYTVEFNGQSLSLHFSKEFTFVRMFWASQGITLLPPGEKKASEEL